jgi:hypothetical protein
MPQQVRGPKILRKPTTGMAARLLPWVLYLSQLPIAHLSGQMKETGRKLADEETSERKGVRCPQLA